jgi:hypothetical protein
MGNAYDGFGLGKAVRGSVMITIASGQPLKYHLSCNADEYSFVALGLVQFANCQISETHDLYVKYNGVNPSYSYPVHLITTQITGITFLSLSDEFVWRVRNYKGAPHLVITMLRDCTDTELRVLAHSRASVKDIYDTRIKPLILERIGYEHVKKSKESGVFLGGNT